MNRIDGQTVSLNVVEGLSGVEVEGQFYEGLHPSLDYDTPSGPPERAVFGAGGAITSWP